ncbi:MAG: amino acid permease [Gemmatimonadetes bacterium]|nr:amino acid permease [Gemmatimonadota bacterium]
MVAQRVGSAGLTVGVWVIGGGIALAGAFCFAELGANRPQAGGGYVYLRDGFGPLPAFLYGWTLLLVIATGAIAAVGVTFARYATALLGAGDECVVPIAIGAIVALSAVNYLGVRPGAMIQNVFTVLKLVALGTLIVAGLVMEGPEASGLAVADAVGAPLSFAALPAVIGVALLPVLFSYGGWQQTNYVAEEIIAPERTLPRALVLGVLGVVMVYVLVNMVYVGVLGVEGLAASQAPASDVMELLLGPRGAAFISAGIVVSTFGFLNLVILVTPRVYQAMARDGVFFQRVAKLHPRFRTPTAAIVFQGTWAIVLTLSGTYGQLLDYVVFGDWIFFGLVAATVFVFRKRSDELRFKAPGYPWVPALFVAAAGYVVVSSIVSNPGNALLGSGLIALGVPAYVFWKRRTGR